MYRTLLALCIAAWVPTGVASDCPDTDAAALEWLDKMSRNMREVSYQGVVTLQRDKDLQVVQVSNFVVEGAATERLTELTGQGAQVVRAAHPLECIHPGELLLRLTRDIQAGDCSLAQHYRFGLVKGERIAGRKAVRIRIEPRDMYRHGYVMALDRETGLLLKTEMIGQGDRVLESFQFAHLSYSQATPAEQDVHVVHAAQHPHADDASMLPPVGRGWQVTWVPDGFVATDEPSLYSGRRTYTDGLAVFSIFIEDLKRGMRPGEGLIREGGTTAYTRGMRLTGHPVLVTVLGEVPANTARMVADSVRWTP